MRWNNDKKHEHPKMQEGSRSRIKDAWKKAMDSAHNKFSRGAEFITRLITSAHGNEWRANRGHNPDMKHHGHRNQDKKK